MKKLTVSEINAKLKLISNGEIKINWKKSGEYESNRQKVLAVHKLFGQWEVTIQKLLSGRSHPSSMTKYKTKKDLESDIQKIHSGNVKINWNKTKFPLVMADYVFAIDKDFGQWETRFGRLIQGEGHKERYYQSKRLSSSDIDDKVKTVHEGRVSIIWNEPYKSNKQKVVAKDIEYGQWSVTVAKLLRGGQHPVRSNIEKGAAKALNPSDIDSRILKIHKGLISIDWNKSEPFKNAHSKVVAVDVDFGEWTIKVAKLLQGQGHRERNSSEIRLKPKEIDNQVKKIFKGAITIDWDKSGAYKSRSLPIFAIHNKKGEWKTTVASLLSGHNHPSVSSNSSKGEKEILKWLRKLKQKVIHQKVIRSNNKSWELDIFLPEHNLAIEYHGVYFHCELFKDANYHNEKRLSCEALGIELIQIYEPEWQKRQNVVKNIILSKINNFNKNIFFKTISKKDSQNFLSNNSLVVCKAPKLLGAFNGNELVGVIGFSSNKNEMSMNFVVTNFKMTDILPLIENYLISKFNLKSIKIHLDNRFYSNIRILSNGFNNLDTKIDYIWTDLKKIYSEKPNTRRILKIYEPGKSILLKKL